MSEPVLNLLIIIIAVILLSIAAYQDIEARLVSDWIWLLMIGGGSILHLSQFIISLNSPNSSQEYLFGLSLNIIIAILFGLFLTLSALGGLISLLSYQDTKERFASGWVWDLIIGIGSILYVLQFIISLNSPNNSIEYLIGLFLSIIIAFLLGLLLTFSALGELLSLAYYQDIKERLVSYWGWILIVGSGSILYILQFIISLNSPNNSQEYIFGLSLNIIIAILFGLFLTLSAVVGEADRIVFLAIAFVTPLQSAIFPIANPEIIYVFSFFPKIIGTVLNAYLFIILLAILAPIGFFLYNMYLKSRKKVKFDYPKTSRWTKLFLLFIGYPKATNAISKEINEKPWNFDFLEDFVDGEWKIEFQKQLDTEEADLEKKLKLVELLETNKKDFVWVQPSIPFIFFIFIGFIAEILMGNLILSIMSYIF